ncbi:MAG: hypothetical protein ABI573_03450 [Chloroflexota bacterium]
MTLPFRRRHNDAEASHDRARALIANGFTTPNEPIDVTWLDDHIAGCAECAADLAAYAADRELLRALRDHAPEPPRDLWARTAAAIEQDHARRGRGARALRATGSWRIGRIPVGVASGLLVVVVVLGVSLAPRGGIPLASTPGSSQDVAVGTPKAEATPIGVTAGNLAWIQSGPDGSYEFRRAVVDSVCPDSKSGCATLDLGSTTRISLEQPPQAVVESPTGSEIVVVTSPASVGGTDILVVSVPTAPPVPQTTPSAAASPETAPPSPTVLPSGSIEPTVGHSIVSGVAVVGDTAYSPDGKWLAFSARQADGSAGPDLYLWHVGDELATQISANHRTFFAGWIGDQILANVVLADGSFHLMPPLASIEPASAPGSSDEHKASPDVSPDASTSPDASAPLVEEHPLAFTLDPATRDVTVIAAENMWLPTVDPTGRSVVYWEGTLIPNAAGTEWSLGEGRLVLDGWVSAGGLAASPKPAASPSASPKPKPTAHGKSSPTPDPTSSPGTPTVVPTVGPAGHPVTIAEGSAVAFDSWFDPTGLRLAIWIADPTDQTVGTLRLIVLDPETLQIDPSSDPLPGVAALRGVSMDKGRLAWVTPPGQDGEGSHVQVLGWHGRSFGQVRTIQADKLYVVR